MRKVVALASSQHGVVTRERLLAIGLSSSTIGRWVEKGLLIPIYPGVYRVGHAAPSTEATYMAAVLAAGDGALLSGRAAGHLLRLLKGAPPPPEVIATAERRVKGLDARRERGLDPRDATKHRGIRTTTIARTLVDLAATLPPHQLGQAWHQARVLYRTEPEDVEAVLERRRRTKGAGTLRSIMRGDIKVSLSRLERRFLKLLGENDLELPEANNSAGGRYVDCRWPAHELTVELDSYRYHSSPRLGAGPEARAPGARPWRRLSALHVRRCVRGSARTAAGTSPDHRPSRHRNFPQFASKCPHPGGLASFRYSLESRNVIPPG